MKYCDWLLADLLKMRIYIRRISPVNISVIDQSLTRSLFRHNVVVFQIRSLKLPLSGLNYWQACQWLTIEWVTFLHPRFVREILIFLTSESFNFKQFYGEWKLIEKALVVPNEVVILAIAHKMQVGNRSCSHCISCRAVIHCYLLCNDKLTRLLYSDAIKLFNTNIPLL